MEFRRGTVPNAETNISERVVLPCNTSSQEGIRRVSLQIHPCECGFRVTFYNESFLTEEIYQPLATQKWKENPCLCFFYHIALSCKISNKLSRVPVSKKSCYQLVRLEDFTVVILKIKIFLNVRQCRLVNLPLDKL